MWQKFRGTNKNTGDEVDEWRCAVSTLPMLLVEVAQQTRGVGAATESFRNEVVSRADNASRQRIASHENPIMIEAE